MKVAKVNKGNSLQSKALNLANRSLNSPRKLAKTKKQKERKAENNPRRDKLSGSGSKLQSDPRSSLDEETEDSETNVIDEENQMNLMVDPGNTSYTVR